MLDSFQVFCYSVFVIYGNKSRRMKNMAHTWKDIRTDFSHKTMGTDSDITLTGRTTFSLCPWYSEFADLLTDIASSFLLPHLLRCYGGKFRKNFWKSYHCEPFFWYYTLLFFIFGCKCTCFYPYKLGPFQSFVSPFARFCRLGGWKSIKFRKFTC